MSRLLVTGASGFIGSHLTRAAVMAGLEVHTTSLRRRPPIAGVIHHTADLLSTTGVEALLDRARPTHLIHLAWYVEPGAYWTSPVNDQWARASAGLFRAFARRGGTRCVGVGTSAEYDWSAGVLRESAPPAPSTVYGRAKAALAADLAETGISAAWARLFMVYGPGEPPQRFIPTAIRTLSAGETVRCIDPVRRDFLFVADAASALLAIALSTVEGAVNVGSGEAHALCDVASRLRDRIGRGSVERVPAGNEAPLVVADVTRLREEVRFRPATSLEAGLDAGIEWWAHNASE